MTTIAVLGAGAIGLGMAAQFSRQAHEVRLFGRSLTTGSCEIHAQGALEWRGPVAAYAEIGGAVAGAEVVVLCVPGDGQKAMIDALVPVLEDGQTVVISAQYSLSALYLSKRLSERGLKDVPIVALATTMLTGRRTSAQSVRVLSIRKEYGFALYAHHRAAETAALIRALSGKDLTQVAMTEIAFGNANPIAHVPNALCNLTRIELGEDWSNYGKMTASVCALIEKLDAERCRIAGMFGAAPDPPSRSICTDPSARRSALCSRWCKRLARPAAAERPNAMSSRYITEDVPYGWCLSHFWRRSQGKKPPRIQPSSRCFQPHAGAISGAENDLLAGLSLRGRPLAEIRQKLEAGWTE